MTNIPQLLAKTGDGLFAIDRAQRIIFWNQAAHSVFGLPEDEAIGHRCYEVLRGCDEQGRSVCGRDCWVFQAVGRKEEVPSQELRLRRADGRLLGCSMSVITIDDASDDAQAIVMFRRTRPVHPPEPSLPSAVPSGPGEPAPVRVAIRCFGAFEVRLGGASLTGPPLSQNKAGRALRLLVHRRGQRVNRDELTEVLWPNAEPDGARAGLKVIIHALRRALEPDLGPRQLSRYIGYENDAYFFTTSSDCWVDADAFLEHVSEGQEHERCGATSEAQAHYLEAVRLYHGDYLTEDLYEDWCAGERQRWRETYIATLMALASTYESQHDYTRAVDCCWRALASDGCRESTYRSLMQYLYCDGRGHEALQVYRRCREVLARELGVPPLAETAEMHLRIKKALSRGSIKAGAI